MYNRHEPLSLTIIRLNRSSLSRGDTHAFALAARAAVPPSSEFAEKPPLRNYWSTMTLQSVDKVLGVEFQLLQAYFFELLIR